MKRLMPRICVLIIYDSVLVAPQLQGAATGGIGDSFVLLPRILWCWVSFARAFLHGRLAIRKSLSFP